MRFMELILMRWGGVFIIIRKLMWLFLSVFGVKNIMFVISVMINWKIIFLLFVVRKNLLWCVGNVGRVVDEFCLVCYWYLFKLLVFF